MLVFSSFSPTEVTVQKQIEFNFWSDVQNLNASDKNREREREKKDTKQLYKFLPQTRSSPVPLALPRRVHKNQINDYNCSLLKLARDFKLLKHNCKRFPMLKNKIKRLHMLKHNCKRLLFKQNYKEICLRLNTWYTISGVHNTNQIQTRKTLEFLRYELW